MIAATIFGALAVLGLALVLWQFICAHAFPLHRRVSDSGFAPAVSILKPLKGIDSETRKCLESWMTQQYSGKVQILFGVHSADDPVCDLVRELIAAHQQLDAQLIMCPKHLGDNAKVSTLVQLQSLAKHDFIAVSDADVTVPADFLAQAVGPLHSGSIGLVNCFYKLSISSNLAMRCEAFTVNADFWAQVLQARAIKPLSFALGAVMIVPRKRLEQIGAFGSLLEYLADDYQLGHRIAQHGREIFISPVVVECRSSPMTAREVWRHQLRWARTVRACQPAPYFLSILNNVTVWSFFWAVNAPAAVPYAAGFLAARSITAGLTEAKMLGRFSWHSVVLAIPCDALRLLLWGLSFLGSKVEWRGARYRILRHGKLQRLSQRVEK